MGRPLGERLTFGGWCSVGRAGTCIARRMGSVSVVSMVGSKPRQVVRPRFTARSTFRLPALERFRIGDHPTHRVSCRVHGLETMQPCNNGATNCRSPWIVQWMRMSFRGRWCLHCGLEGRLKNYVKPSPNGFIEAITSRCLDSMDIHALSGPML
jgi:hypothetical protein